MRKSSFVVEDEKGRPHTLVVTGVASSPWDTLVHAFAQVLASEKGVLLCRYNEPVKAARFLLPAGTGAVVSCLKCQVLMNPEDVVATGDGTEG